MPDIYIEGIDRLPAGAQWTVRLVDADTPECLCGRQATRRQWDDGVTVTECNCGLYDCRAAATQSLFEDAP